MKRIGRNAKRGTAIAAILGALVGTTGVTTASAANAPEAAAVSCSGWSITHTDPGTYAKMIGTFNLKKGPYASCGNVTSVAKDTKFWIWCMTWNEYGNTWYYGRIAGTDTKGWMSQDNLYDWQGNHGYTAC